MAVLLSRLGGFSHRHRLPVVLLWLVVLVGGGVGAATLAGETSSSFSIPGQESTTALERIGAKFGTGGEGATARWSSRAPRARRSPPRRTLVRSANWSGRCPSCRASPRRRTRWTRPRPR